ncbi:hypothetical protein GOARA_026_00080 [Gordonia araii NBRC 100433]|uniref:Excalibur calcium-binding domain-containing protein n=1 Tax=Gordonia araii NBRC 100433 TaxID=1073574 RepID=G7GZF4_9ACTN|nr:excalibur calcium-binding domain-containing protein [Gordonia araii]NNG97949.1 excalibur calcium-binding domain-containing protein [Gordonia araii NBRC 100433]GAB08979.1 hypothetical protein GOARA_026_00080 [Gordonia araii NBRC 100433]
MTVVAKTLGAVLFAAAGLAPSAVVGTAYAAPLPGATQVKYYENCDAVRADGADPLHKGQDGYAAHLDRDDDGIACE